ncbi:hypothetical protein ACFWC5_42735, partial [Streptomyces sp. NPDC060085]
GWVDPGWSPAWKILSQRSYRLALAHVRAGGELPYLAGELIVQVEDLEAWVIAQPVGWERLMPAQRFLLEPIGMDALADDKVGCWSGGYEPTGGRPISRCGPPFPRPRGAPAGAQEAHGGCRRRANQTRGLLHNARRRAANLSEQRRGKLDELGMHW